MWTALQDALLICNYPVIFWIKKLSAPRKQYDFTSMNEQWLRGHCTIASGTAFLLITRTSKFFGNQHLHQRRIASLWQQQSRLTMRNNQEVKLLADVNHRFFAKQHTRNIARRASYHSWRNKIQLSDAGVAATISNLASTLLSRLCVRQLNHLSMSLSSVLSLLPNSRL